MSDELTPKQVRFIEEYLVDLNGTQAAIRAGYSPDSATVQASKMLTLPKIQEALTAKQSKRAARLEVSVDRIEKELARIAFADMKRFAQWGPTKAALDSERQAGLTMHSPLEDDGFAHTAAPNGVLLLSSDELSEDDTAAVAQVTESALPGGGLKYGIKLHDKLRALELLGKRHGMFEETLRLKADNTLADVMRRALSGEE